MEQDPVVEALSRVVARRTDAGEIRLILSDAGISDWMRRHGRMSAIDDPGLRSRRNPVSQVLVVFGNYDEVLEAKRTRTVAPDRVLTEAIRTELCAARARADAGATSEAEPSWVDVAAGFVEGFVLRLVDHADVLSKVSDDEAAAMGRIAADHAVAALRWSQVVGDRIDTTGLCQLLGVSRQALAKRQAAGSLLGLPGRGTTWYPTWQFDLDARDVRPEVRDIIGAFRDRLDDVDPLLIASWAVTPQVEDLDGMAPEEWLRRGLDRGQLRIAAQRAASRHAR